MRSEPAANSIDFAASVRTGSDILPERNARLIAYVFGPVTAEVKAGLQAISVRGQYQIETSMYAAIEQSRSHVVIGQAVATASEARAALGRYTNSFTCIPSNPTAQPRQHGIGHSNTLAGKPKVLLVGMLIPAMQGIRHVPQPTSRGASANSSTSEPRFWLLTQPSSATQFIGGIAVAVGDVDG
jgi:hypothetical protein